MTTFPNSPRLLKGDISSIDPNMSAVRRVIAHQYNQDSPSRTLPEMEVQILRERSGP